MISGKQLCMQLELEETSRVCGAHKVAYPLQKPVENETETKIVTRCKFSNLSPSAVALNVLRYFLSTPYEKYRSHFLLAVNTE